MMMAGAIMMMTELTAFAHCARARGADLFLGNCF
jgi:hypothetical protein